MQSGVERDERVAAARRRAAAPVPAGGPSGPTLDPGRQGEQPTARNCGPLLRRFLQAYWLRPENAFWMTLRSQTLSQTRLDRPCVDISCGDGVFSFLHCGGAFDPDFDVFTAVGRLDRVRDDHADIFDVATDEYRPTILSPPAQTVDVGTDRKQALLAKAARLGIYDRLVEHDNNRPLPFDDGAFQTVYCNAAYWVNRIDGFLGEMRRIARPEGRIVLQVKLDSMRRYTLTDYESTFGRRFLDIIGRGRIETWLTVASRQTWEARFARAGLTVESATPFITRTHAHIWDIGLRPIAPMLIRMANALTPATRASIKRDWVELFCELLSPVCDPDFDLFPVHDEPAEIQYVLIPG